MPSTSPHAVTNDGETLTSFRPNFTETAVCEPCSEQNLDRLEMLPAIMT